MGKWWNGEVVEWGSGGVVKRWSINRELCIMEYYSKSVRKISEGTVHVLCTCTCT